MNTLQQVIKQRMDESKKYPSHKELDMDFYRNIVEAGNFDSMFNHGFDFANSKNQETIVAILEAVKEWAEKQDGFELGEKVFFNQISRIDLLYFLSSTLQEIKNQK